VKQQIKQVREQLGWQGMSGIVMLIIAGAFQMLALQPLEQETMFMHSRLDVARDKLNASARTFNLGDRQKELEVFFDSLPDESDVTDILASIAVIAEASGVELKQAEYHLDNKNRPRVEYGLFFPVQGGYANIRHFVSRVLADHPAIALDQINFQRDRINDSILKAEIRLTLFLRPNN
jgi:Tfp pilus assembly protein PilO